MTVICTLQRETEYYGFPAAEYFMESPDTVAIPIIDQGDLIPRRGRILQSHC